jgi:hypothetical protein
VAEGGNWDPTFSEFVGRNSAEGEGLESNSVAEIITKIAVADFRSPSRGAD